MDDRLVTDGCFIGIYSCFEKMVIGADPKFRTALVEVSEVFEPELDEGELKIYRIKDERGNFYDFRVDIGFEPVIEGVLGEPFETCSLEACFFDKRMVGFKKKD